MICEYETYCGGCPFRTLGEKEYQKRKLETFKKIIANLAQKDLTFSEPIFIGDSTRRRAEFSFERKKGKLIFGFNARQTHEIVDIENCALLTAELNSVLPIMRKFTDELCQITTTKKEGKKIKNYNISKGQIFLTQAQNGIDISLEVAENPELDHRLLIAELINNTPQIISFSWKNQKGN